MSTLTQFLSGKLKSQEFLSSGTFTVPAGVTTVWVTMCGGGGSGAAQYNLSGAGGGGAGAYCIQRPVNVTPGASVTVTIGAGGAGVAGGYPSISYGNNGGATSFGSVSVSGGGGGSRGLDNNNAVLMYTAHAGVGGANGGSIANSVIQQADSIGGRPGLFNNYGGAGGGGGGLFGDGTDGGCFTNTGAAAANSGAGSGGIYAGTSASGGSGRCIVEWIA